MNKYLLLLLLLPVMIFAQPWQQDNAILIPVEFPVYPFLNLVL